MYGQERRIRKSKGNIWFIFLRILLFPRVFRHAVKDFQNPEMNDFELLNMSRLRRDCQPALCLIRSTGLHLSTSQPVMRSCRKSGVLIVLDAPLTFFLLGQIVIRAWFSVILQKSDYSYSVISLQKNRINIKVQIKKGQKYPIKKAQFIVKHNRQQNK